MVKNKFIHAQLEHTVLRIKFYFIQVQRYAVGCDARGGVMRNNKVIDIQVGSFGGAGRGVAFQQQLPVFYSNIFKVHSFEHGVGNAVQYYFFAFCADLPAWKLQYRPDTNQGIYQQLLPHVDSRQVPGVEIEFVRLQGHGAFIFCGGAGN